jgi:hypothetical protein
MKSMAEMFIGIVVVVGFPVELYRELGARTFVVGLVIFAGIIASDFRKDQA